MITGIHPTTGPRPTKSSAERAVWEALRQQLPRGWAAWHSLRIRTPSGFEGENDFVLWVPGRGVILLEVKGGRVKCTDGKWHQGGKPMPKAPLDQVRHYKSKLVATLQRRHAGISCHIATALCLPDTAFSTSPSASDLEGCVIGKQDMSRLGHALELLASRVFSVNSRPIRGDVPWALHSLFGETWVPRLCLGDQITQREQELVPLDAQQLQVLEMMTDNASVLFKGGPGTGKTLLAAEQARRLQRQGKRPLYLCSTASLARSMRELVDFPVFTVRDLAVDALDRLGVKLQDGAPLSEWTPDTWLLAPSVAATKAASLLRDKYDAVLVDEAQDFSAGDWDLVRVLAQAQPLWAFADPGQAFWEERTVPEGLFATKVRLPTGYRCPASLLAFANLYRDGQVPANEQGHGATQSTDELQQVLTVLKRRKKISLEKALAKSIAALIAEGARAQDIAVLSLGGQTQSALCHWQSIGDHPVRRGDAPDAAGHIVCDTFARFKGLERPIVFVAELDRARTRYDVRMHTALSRAGVHCIVVVNSADLERDVRLGAVAEGAR